MVSQEYIDELKTITDTLKNKPQYIGFNHKFYVPGWVGFIQQAFVESKMNKIDKRPIYNGKGYYDCGFKIAELVYDACEAKRYSHEDFVKNNDDEETILIFSSAMEALGAWENVYPEMAHWMNRKINDKYITNTISLLSQNIRGSLEKIMDFPDVDSLHQSKSSSFVNEMKDMGNWLLAYVCNMIVFIAIFSVLIAIFG